MREERIRTDLEGTWSTVLDVTGHEEARISLKFDGTERQLRNWLPDDYEVIETVDEGDGITTALIHLDADG